MPTSKHAVPFAEFVALMALMTSLIALTIDAILPALPQIALDLTIMDLNDTQLLVSMVFLGMAIGQLFYGPIADRYGRKPAVYTGLLIYMIGCVISLFAQSLTIMLIGRALQGFGLSAPKVVCVAIVRDQYQGDAMARVMSFIMMIFILVPALAPAIGQSILLIASWQAIFMFFILLMMVTFTWFGFRQKETLNPSNRRSISYKNIASGIQDVIQNPLSLGCTLALGFISAPFIAYLSSAQQIFQSQYGLGQWFPLIFAALALSVGAASFLNSKLVMKFGMQMMAMLGASFLTVTALCMAILAQAWAGQPPLFIYFAYCSITLFCVGILFGNLNAMAMVPLGHIAGLGAALVGSIATTMSIPFAILIGQAYDGSVNALVWGFGIFGAITLALLMYVRHALSRNEVL